MDFWNKLKKMQKLGFYLGLFFIGILFTVVGALILASPKKEKLAVTATVVSVETEMGTSEDTPSYLAEVEYTVEGKTYTGTVGASSNTKQGDTLTVYCDPDDPSRVSNTDSPILPIIILIAGLCALVYSVITFAKTLKTDSREMDQLDRVKPEEFSPEMVARVQNSTEAEAEYYFHWCGKLNQSYLLETPERQAVYKADCDKITLFKPYVYSFRDCRSGAVTVREVSHTTTTRYGSGSFSTVSKSQFKLDGECIWDVLAKQGYALKPQMQGIKMNFTLTRYGVPVGRLEAAGVNILRDDKQYSLGNTPGKGLYKAYCRDEDVEMCFLACFAVSRVDFF